MIIISFPLSRAVSSKIFVIQLANKVSLFFQGNYFATAKLINEDGICLGMTESNINL